MKKHYKQLAAFHDKTRFKYILAGRRGGKTHMIREDICRRIAMAPKGGRIVYMGPNNKQAKEIMWDVLEERLEQLKWNFTPKISKDCFELSRKRKIYIIGAEKYTRVRGWRLWDAYLDEIAFFEKPLAKIWRAVRPALSDFRGRATWSTTPDGKGTEAYDAWLQAMEKKNWATFSWTTADNPWIDRDEIVEAQYELDEKSFMQEYEALWQSFEGLAYYNFAESTHITKQSGIIPAAPLHMCFDFNVNPTSLLLSQHVQGKLRYIQEYSEANSSTEDTVKHFCEEHGEFIKRNGVQLKIRGDASGKARTSATGRSDYFYVEEMLREFGFTYEREVPAKNPPVIDRVKYVNGWLKPMKGEPRILIDPSCKDLIRDLSSQGLDGRVPSKKNNLGHKADAFGYDIYWQHIMGQRLPQRTIQL